MLLYYWLGPRIPKSQRSFMQLHRKPNSNLHFPVLVRDVPYGSLHTFANTATSNQCQTAMTWLQGPAFYFSKNPFSADHVFVYFERHSRARFRLVNFQIVRYEISNYLYPMLSRLTIFPTLCTISVYYYRRPAFNHPLDFSQQKTIGCGQAPCQILLMRMGAYGMTPYDNC